METLQFILSTWYNFLGTILLIFVAGVNVANIVKSFALVRITNNKTEHKTEMPPIKEQAEDLKDLWKDILSKWDKNEKV
jgi:hypothetical protein